MEPLPLRQFSAVYLKVVIACLLVLSDSDHLSPVAGHTRFHHARSDHDRLAQVNTHVSSEVRSLESCRLQASAAGGNGMCPKDWNSNIASTNCCQSDATLAVLPASTDTYTCCEHGQCQSLTSQQVNSVYTCPASTTASSSTQRTVYCCSALCCSQPAKDTRGSMMWWIILLMTLLGLALILSAVVGYVCWRQHNRDEAKPSDQHYISPSKKPRTKIRMDPPPLQMSQTDITISGVDYPNLHESRTPSGSTQQLANTSFYGSQAPAELETRRLAVTTQQDEDAQVPERNNVTGVKVDVPFVSRTRVQPVASMQNIIPR